MTNAPRSTTEPAFPNSFSADYPTEITGGMTLRDYFAAKCMHGLNKSMVDYGWEDDVLMGYAKQAYRIADAMMEARK